MFTVFFCVFDRPGKSKFTLFFFLDIHLLSNLAISETLFGAAKVNNIANFFPRTESVSFLLIGKVSKYLRTKSRSHEN